jgi:hypothetical protein
MQITVPEELRNVPHANQRDGYGHLMKAAAESMKWPTKS